MSNIILFILVTFSFIYGGSGTMDSKHTIGIIIFDDVLTSEVIAPAEIFGRAAKQEWFKDWQVKFIGVEKKPTITTEEGITISVNSTIYDDLNLDVLIVPGAQDVQSLMNNKDLESFIIKHEKKVEWLSSNCSGAFLLANSGVLDSVKATTWSGGEELLQHDFPKINVLFDNPVVLDNRKLTSNGGLVSYQAALVLLGKLSSMQHAREIFDGLQMDKMIDWKVIEKFYEEN